MAGPLIPYIEAPEIPLSFLEYIPLLGDLVDPRKPPSIKPFGTLVALGVYIGSMVTMARAKDRKLDTKLMSDFIFWVVAAGFVISHMLDAIFYHPQRVMADPLYVLRIWDGLSSYGGFIGAVVGAVAWRFYRKKDVLEYIDITVSAFPIAWVFGRTGCSVVHDHPGALSNAWFAVKYPAHTLQAGFDGRYDLGLIEMVLTIPLAAACIWLWKKKPFRPTGFYIGVTLTAYAPVRFGLDYLRVTPDDAVFGGAIDPRYAGLTPAQWACFLALGVGLYFLKRTHGQEYVRSAELEPEDAGDDDEAKEIVDASSKDDDEDEAKAKPKSKAKATKAKAKAEDAEEADEAEDADEAPKKKPAKKKRRKKKKPAKDE